MNAQLTQLVSQVKQSSTATERQNGLTILVDQMLRSRPISRAYLGKSPQGVYLDIYQGWSQSSFVVCCPKY